MKNLFNQEINMPLVLGVTKEGEIENCGSLRRLLTMRELLSLRRTVQFAIDKRTLDKIEDTEINTINETYEEHILNNQDENQVS